MLLEEWLEVNQVSMRDFAREIGAKHHTTVYRYLGSERRIPDKRLAKAIYVATNGEVRPDHFYDLPTLPLKKKSKARQH